MLNKTTPLLSLALIASTTSLYSYAQTENDSWRFQPEFSLGAGYGLTKIKDGDFDEARSNGLSVDADGQSLALILEAPITEGISIYAKGGQLWWDADASVNSATLKVKNSYDGDETFWGGGAKFRLAEHLDLRLEYERFNFDISRDEIDVLQTNDIDMDVDFASVSLQFTF